jgi:hypothetical protein
MRVVGGEGEGLGRKMSLVWDMLRRDCLELSHATCGLAFLGSLFVGEKLESEDWELLI